MTYDDWKCRDVLDEEMAADDERRRRDEACCYDIDDWPDCCEDEIHCCYNRHSPKVACGA